jgi:PBSX family phage terminase large subunit
MVNVAAIPIRAQFTKTSDQKKLTRLLILYSRVLAHGGSRSGKTFEMVRALCIRACKSPGSRHLITRFHFRDAKIAIFMDTLPKVLHLCFPELKSRVNFNKTDFFVTFPNGSEIWIGGLDDKERTDKILGLEYATIFFNESSQISFMSIQTALTRLAQKCEGLKNKAYFDCNPPRKKHWLFKLFFQKIDPETKKVLLNPDSYAEILMNPDGNRENLPEGYIEETLETLTDKKRDRFRYGLWLDDVEGAAWKRSWIDATRVVNAPAEMYRIVVGVDPAGTHNKKSNSTGIVVAGVDMLGHYYVLADRTIDEATPEEWGNAVVNAYREFKADKVIGEVNYGGDLVERNINVCDSTVAFEKTWSSRGKILRAEPISSLFQKGMAHIVGEFPELEDEMANYSPLMQTEEKMESPDHLDAMVFALTALVEGNHPGEPIPLSMATFGGISMEDERT